MKIRWYGTPKLDRRLARNIDAAGRRYAAAVRERISVQGPPPSLPGEAPHVDSAALINSIDTATVQVLWTSQVSSDVPHSVYLEFGTDRMAPRPFWIPTLIDQADDLARTICDA